MRNKPDSLPLSLEEFKEKYSFFEFTRPLYGSTYGKFTFHTGLRVWYFDNVPFTGIMGEGLESGHVCFSWYLNGILHRFNGPAMVGYNPNGLISRVTKNWYLYDKKINYAEYRKFCIKYKLDFNNLSPEDEILIRMNYS